MMHYMQVLKQGMLLVLLVFVLYAKGAGSAPCSFKSEGPKGTISFRGSGSITNCSWLITAPLNHSIVLTFATFQLYYKFKSVQQLLPLEFPPTEKEASRLEIWDGQDENATLLGSFRGTKRPFSLQSSGHHLFLRLIVDPGAPLCNFEGSYIATTTKEKPKLKIPAAVVIALPYQYLWCSAEGTPPVNVAIMRNNDVLTNSIGYARVTVDSEGAGTYRCVASNEAGMDSKDVQVTLTKVCDESCLGWGEVGPFPGEMVQNVLYCSFATNPKDIFKCSPMATIFTKNGLSLSRYRCVITLYLITSCVLLLETVNKHKIREIPANSLHNMSSLKILDLRLNELRTFKSDVFRDLLELRELFLMGNKIEDLPDGIFATLFNLQILDISSNQIEKLPKKLLANMVTLQRLDASNNKIDEIYSETFWNLSSLVRLHATKTE
ncbi:uncharacterized protein LOC144647926 [Oculina patagonica]